MSRLGCAGGCCNKYNSSEWCQGDLQWGQESCGAGSKIRTYDSQLCWVVSALLEDQTNKTPLPLLYDCFDE